jgi:hypothetical protein
VPKAACEDVDEEHPAPWPEDDAQSSPAAGELDAEVGELCERAKGGADPLMLDRDPAQATMRASRCMHRSLVAGGA